jgi:type VI secretion system secreted protein VgrG
MAFRQADRRLAITTGLGADALMLTSVRVSESLSRPFEVELEAWAEKETRIEFDKILGQPVHVEIRETRDKVRHFHGVCVGLTKGVRDARGQRLELDVAPDFWLLTKRVQSRIFQAQTVPDVLTKVLAGIKTDFRIQGRFQPRDFLVQYRESDFDFANRLMEEEGIFYWFAHSKGGATMVIANTPQGHDAIEGGDTLVFDVTEGVERETDRVYSWEKSQEIVAGKVTLWDHCFELPGKNLEAQKTLQSSAEVGTVSHKLALAASDKLELYDYPGGYAQRFDGVDRGGSPQPAEVDKIFEDKDRAVAIRIGEEAAQAVEIEGDSNVTRLEAGRTFCLTKHDDGNGKYVLTSVEHTASEHAVSSGGGGAFSYANRFTAIPFSIPYRPPCVTEEPVVCGSQTAVVVGPSGEEIFTDKYGRVKVQFAWDREGKKDAASSCWVRVASHWAGKQWGAIHIPRIGQEVVVDFLEGDPDQPIIVGSVYNAEQMPPYALPDEKTQSGVKTRSTPTGGVEDSSEICFEDKKGSELLYIRSQKDLTLAAENDEATWVGHDRTLEIENDDTITVKNDRTEEVVGAETVTVHKDRKVTIGKTETLEVSEDRTETIKGADTLTIEKTRTVSVKEDETVTVGGERKASIGKTDQLEIEEGRKTSVGKDDELSVGGALKVTAGNELTLKCGSAELTLKKDGTIQIKGGSSSIVVDQKGVTIGGMKISVKADGVVDLKGAMVKFNGDGMVKLQGGVAMIN